MDIKKKKTNLLNLDKEKMEKFFKKLGEKTYRANQIMKWIYHKYCDNFDKMNNINKILKKKLKSVSTISTLKIYNKKISIDGTIKWIFKIKNKKIETIYIPNKKKATLCLSSQIGCPIKCKFCLTGKSKFTRNLKVHEIISQIWKISEIIYKNKEKYKPITNIVMMGMGEPLLNIKNVICAIKIINNNFGFGISKRKITLSTSGISPAIIKLANQIDIKLAISLHAPNNEIRNQIIPINQKYNIQSILKSAQYFLKKTKSNKKKITIEYIMLKKINDSEKNAHKLVKCLKDLPCKINLIPFNTFPDTSYKASSDKQINQFAKILKKKGFITTIRKSRGKDIKAACGQLSEKN